MGGRDGVAQGMSKAIVERSEKLVFRSGAIAVIAQLNNAQPTFRPGTTILVERGTRDVTVDDLLTIADAIRAELAQRSEVRS